MSQIARLRVRLVPRVSRAPHLIVAIVAAWSLCGCEQAPPVTVGQVISKDFEPEHEVDDSYTITVDDISIPIDDHHTVPDRWTVTIQSLIDARESIHEIDRATYDRIRLNEYYRIGQPGSTPDRPTEGGEVARDGGWQR